MVKIHIYKYRPCFPLARRGKHLDAVYRIAERLFAVDDDLIQKATGWLLREAGKTDIERLERFLLGHGPAISRTTLRYAIERFPPGKRKLLLNETRGQTIPHPGQHDLKN